MVNDASKIEGAVSLVDTRLERISTLVEQGETKEGVTMRSCQCGDVEVDSSIWYQILEYCRLVLREAPNSGLPTEETLTL